MTVEKQMRLESLDEPSSSPEKCRSRFGILAEFLRPGSIGAEVGVFKGAFVDYLLSTNPSKLYLVDPWYRLSPDWPWAKGDPSTVRALLGILDAFHEEISAGTVEPWVEFSQDFLASLEDDHLDWIYIDSTHGYNQTKIELELSLSKVKPTGFILGDDYTADPNHPHHGVHRVVKEYESAGRLSLVVDGTGRQFVARRTSTAS